MSDTPDLSDLTIPKLREYAESELGLKIPTTVKAKAEIIELIEDEQNRRSEPDPDPEPEPETSEPEPEDSDTEGDTSDDADTDDSDPVRADPADVPEAEAAEDTSDTPDPDPDPDPEAEVIEAEVDTEVTLTVETGPVQPVANTEPANEYDTRYAGYAQPYAGTRIGPDGRRHPIGSPNLD